MSVKSHEEKPHHHSLGAHKRLQSRARAVEAVQGFDPAPLMRPALSRTDCVAIAISFSSRRTNHDWLRRLSPDGMVGGAPWRDLRSIHPTGDRESLNAFLLLPNGDFEGWERGGSVPLYLRTTIRRRGFGKPPDTPRNPISDGL